MVFEKRKIIYLRTVIAGVDSAVMAVTFYVFQFELCGVFHR